MNADSDNNWSGHLTSGQEMRQWMQDLFPICRSIAGPGVRQTLDYVSDLLPGLERIDLPSGTKVFDWIIPDEWSVEDAYVATREGVRVIDFRENNLHVVNYSQPVEGWISNAELQAHLHSIPDQPDAIPYVTSYYHSSWGFCVKDSLRQELTDDEYFVFIGSKIWPGVLNLAHMVIPGREDRQVLLSTYTCHPSMASNELSGIVIMIALVRFLLSRDLRLSYRVILGPETIGAIAYLSMYLDELKEKTAAGYILTCLGDSGQVSTVIPPDGDQALAVRALRTAANELEFHLVEYPFAQRGSDERQYASPLVNLPVCPISRTKFHCFPEYHTSLDNLDFVSAESLEESLLIVQHAIGVIESNRVFAATCVGEPFMGSRGLRRGTSPGQRDPFMDAVLDVFAYSDGLRDCITVSEVSGIPYARVIQSYEWLVNERLVAEVSSFG
jgi:aminopeptidase-like protein